MPQLCHFMRVLLWWLRCAHLYHKNLLEHWSTFGQMPFVMLQLMVSARIEATSITFTTAELCIFSIAQGHMWIMLTTVCDQCLQCLPLAVLAITNNLFLFAQILLHADTSLYLMKIGLFSVHYTSQLQYSLSLCCFVNITVSDGLPG